MRSLFVAALAALLALPTHAEIVVQPIAFGTAKVRTITRAESCKDFYIRKNGESWQVVPEKEADLKDEKFEKLNGCLGYTGGGAVNAVVFTVATRDTCTTRVQCVSPMIGNPNAPCTNQEFFNHRAQRKEGYFSCNSSFANRKGMFNSLQFDAPIDSNLLKAALSSDSVKAAATEFVQAQYQSILARAVNVDAAICGSCLSAPYLIQDFFNYFSSEAKPEELAAAGRNYINATGARQLPAWMSEKLSPAAAEALVAQGEQDWRLKYAAKLARLVAPDSNIKDIESFIQQKEKQSANNWDNVDFDGQVPKLKALIQNRLAAAAQEAERQRQAEAKRIQTWRNNLRVGSDTFCGPVIEIRQPMIKIAVNAQVQGFSNEAWLKAPDMFPPEYGCRNVNGRLSTYR